VTAVVSWRRQGGGDRPPANEHLEIDDDGSYRLLRSVGSARAGHFAGTLDAPALAEVLALVEAADPADAPTERAGEGAAAEFVGARSATAAVHPQWPGGREAGSWGPLVERLRRLADELTSSPVAAVEATTTSSGDGLVVALEVIGTAPVAVGIHEGDGELEWAGADGRRTQRPLTDEPRPKRSIRDDPAQFRLPVGWRLEVPVDDADATGVLVRCALEWDGGRTKARLRP
jgi:hypothetical protein